jgi:hypothetical protein
MRPCVVTRRSRGGKSSDAPRDSSTDPAGVNLVGGTGAFARSTTKAPHDLSGERGGMESSLDRRSLTDDSSPSGSRGNLTLAGKFQIHASSRRVGE